MEKTLHWLTTALRATIERLARLLREIVANLCTRRKCVIFNTSTDWVLLNATGDEEIPDAARRFPTQIHIYESDVELIDETDSDITDLVIL